MIFFRMDDITPGMNWNRFLEFTAIFNRYDIKPLLGIVPYNADPTLNIQIPRDDFWDQMRLLCQQGWLVAQHGYTHVYETQVSGILGINSRSEFAGLSYQDQYQKIKAGKEIFERNEIYSDIWMAPAHSYDKNTLKALVDLNFKYVTDGYSLWPYHQGELLFVPCQTSQPRRIKYGCLTVCIHSNFVDDSYIKNIEKFIKENREYCKNYSDALMLKPGNFHIGKVIERSILLFRTVINGIS